MKHPPAKKTAIMTGHPVIETSRLRLRVPEAGDIDGLVELLGDAETARHIGGVQDPAQVWRSLATVVGHWQLRGYGFFSVELKDTGEWVGRVGPWYPHGWSQPEVGWSILRRHWGKGYAPEAAAAAMSFAFDTLGWDSAIHLIAAENTASQAVARKLGSVDTRRDEVVAGFGITVDVWGQTRKDWAANRSRFER